MDTVTIRNGLNVTDKFKGFFPYDSYYPFQYESLIHIENALKKYDTVFFEAPTGIGKSVIAFTIAKALNEPYYITCNRLGLLNQYNKEFNDNGLVQAKGRSNFWCNINQTPASKGHCTINPKFDCSERNMNNCEYQNNKLRAYKSESTLMSLRYGFKIVHPGSKYPYFPKRYLTIFDEGHDLEKELMNEISIKITQKDVNYVLNSNLPNYDDVKEWGQFAMRISRECKNEIKLILADLLDTKDQQLSDQLMKKHESYIKIIEKLETGYHIQKNPENWVIERGENKYGKYVEIKPIMVHYFNDYITKFSDKRIIMSATLLDAETLAESLGFDNSKCCFIKVPTSPFPVENRKIYFGNIGKMTRGEYDTTFPVMIDYIDKICCHYNNVKGIILPYTHKLAREISHELVKNGYGGRIITHGADVESRDIAIKQFMNSTEPSILISTYVNQGWSFDDTLARFIILPKIPFPYLGDKQIKIRTNNDPSWYQWQTAMTLVQMAGRGVRNQKDWCDTYILDSSFIPFLRNNTKILPEHFVDAITTDSKELYGIKNRLVNK